MKVATDNKMQKRMGAAVFHSNHFYKSKQQAEFDQRVPVLVQCLSNCTRGVISNQFCGMLPILFVCVCVCMCVHAKSLQLCVILGDPMDRM